MSWLAASVACNPAATTDEQSKTRKETWSIQLDQDHSGTPGRMWFNVDVTVREDSARGSCGGSTVTTALGDFSTSPSRIQTALTGTASASWTQGTGACDGFELTLRPQGKPDIVINARRDLLPNTLADTGFGAVDPAVRLAGTWADGTRIGTAYVYMQKLDYEPDSHFDVQVVVSETGCDQTVICELPYNPAAELCSAVTPYTTPACGLQPRYDYLWTRDTVITRHLPRHAQRIDDKWYFALLARNNKGGPPYFIGCDRAADGPDLVRLRVASGGYFPYASCESGWIPTGVLTKTAGDQQAAGIRTILPAALEVQMLGGAGAPLAQAPISWSVTSGGGTLSAGSSTTDASGHTSVQWTLGSTAGRQTVTATAGVPGGGTTSVTFAATAVATASTLTVTASSLSAPSGGSITLTANVSGGAGPFSYEWEGIRDDGTPYSLTFSNPTGARTDVSFVFPDQDFYFFVTVTDNGIPANQEGHTRTGFIRVHESDGAIGRFSVLNGPFTANVTDVHLDATATTGATPDRYWTLQYLGDVPAPSDIRGYLMLESNSQARLFWTDVDTLVTTQNTATVPASKFTLPGAYRMSLQVSDGLNWHQTYEYFMVRP